MRKYNLAVIGVGAVGVEILKILKERNFPVDSLRVFARSSRTIEVQGITHNAEDISKENFKGIDIALFAGTEGEKGAGALYAHKFIENGAVVIDNGQDFRLKDGVPLVVPEVNKDKLSSHKGLIANPNCTTIQAVTALGGIFKKFGLEQFILTSFQATSGAGRKAAISLWNETKNLVAKNKDMEFGNLNPEIDGRPEFFSNQIAFNIIPQIGSFQKENYTSEEWKVVKETHKIMDDDSIKISATCVRVPVFISHCEAVYFATKDNVCLEALEEVLAESPGVKYLPNCLPFPLQAQGQDEVFVARVRKDPFRKNSFWLWSVCDNLRKGAALNSIQIAECLLKK